VKLEGQRVYLFTHTAQPVPGRVAGGVIYGCTEFIFDVDAESLKTGAVEAVVTRIERWLEWTPGGAYLHARRRSVVSRTMRDSAAPSGMGAGLPPDRDTETCRRDDQRSTSVPGRSCESLKGTRAS
jgi:hypothetical protein